MFLPVQLATGLAMAVHRGVTWDSLAEPGYGRTLSAELALFAVVMLVGSLGVVLPATALPVT
ncbi:hypothetical protein [Streptomyces sp. CRN 30]|uniref:hypothetical protein n=1 Tax=Streptomyces sp. CRN 30 TaxID=3075613 RepID=UPI002A808C06|nr:hypothetical protein [Streptomyces sp. CRN 30]